VDEATLIVDGLARQLGLTADGLRATGSLDGAPIELTARVAQRTWTNHPANQFPVQVRVPEEDRVRLTARLPFWPSLDVGLEAHPVARLPVLRVAGRTGFDRFTVLGGAGAEALLTREVRLSMEASFVADPGIWVTDAGVDWAAEWAMPWPDSAECVAAIRQAGAVWVGVWEAGRTLPPPPDCEDALAVLGRLRRPPGVELRGVPCGLAGRLRDCWLAVTVQPSGDRWRVSVRIRFPQRLPGDVRVIRESRSTWFDRLLATVSGKSDVEIGDPEFDHRFSVRAAAPGLARAELDPAVRGAMLALDAMMAIELDSEGIQGQGTGSLELVGEVAARALTLAQAI
jgi:hypothetical protein